MIVTGIFAHAPSTVTVTVPAGKTRLKGGAGLQLFGQDCSTGVQFSISEGGPLWTSGTLGSYSEAERFDVPVTPGTVTLTADPLGDYSCDTAVWVDLRAI